MVDTLPRFILRRKYSFVLRDGTSSLLRMKEYFRLEGWPKNIGFRGRA